MPFSLNNGNEYGIIVSMTGQRHRFLSKAPTTFKAKIEIGLKGNKNESKKIRKIT